MDKENLEYWYYTEPELDNCLAKFWFGARKDLGEGHDDNEQQDSEEDPNKRERMYKASSLRNFQYSLNRILKSHGHLYDITAKSTSSFGKSQKAFIDAIKELKEEGKGDIESYPEIEEEGTFIPQYFSPPGWSSRYIRRSTSYTIMTTFQCMLIVREWEFFSRKSWWHIKT